MLYANLCYTGQQSVLDAIEKTVMLEHLEVLCFVQEVFVGILTTHGINSHLSLGHLLRDLTGRCVSRQLLNRPRAQRRNRTVVAAQNEVVDGLQTEEGQEVPRQTRNPSDVKVSGTNARLKHRLELRSQRKGKLHDDITREEGIDPAHDQTLGDHHGDLTLHHAHHALHGSRIGHRVTLGLTTHLGLGEEGTILVGLNHVCLASSERGRGELLVVVAEVDTAHERTLLAHLIDGLLLGGGL